MSQMILIAWRGMKETASRNGEEMAWTASHDAVHLPPPTTTTWRRRRRLSVDGMTLGGTFVRSLLFLWRSLTGLEEEDGLLTNVEVDEANLVGDVGAELGADDAVPGGAVFLVEGLLDGQSDVLLLLVSTNSLFAQSDGVSFEGVGHVAGLDPALELDRESRGGGLSGGGLGGGGLGRGGLGGGSLGRGLGSGGFGRGFVRHGSLLQEVM